MKLRKSGQDAPKPRKKMTHPPVEGEADGPPPTTSFAVSSTNSGSISPVSSTTVKSAFSDDAFPSAKSISKVSSKKNPSLSSQNDPPESSSGTAVGTSTSIPTFSISASVSTITQAPHTPKSKTDRPKTPKKTSRSQKAFHDPLSISKAVDDALLINSNWIVSDEINEFHRACQYGQLGSAAQMLKKHLVDIDARDSAQNTALHEAVAYEQLETVKFLLRNGADPNALNMLNERPLDLAGSHQVAEILKNFMERRKTVDSGPLLRNKVLEGRDLKTIEQLLLSKRQELSAAAFADFLHEANADGLTAIHEAAVMNKSDVLHLLFANGCNLSVSANDGNTPLHDACRYSSPQAVQTLLDLGADWRIKNNRGKMAIDTLDKTIWKIFKKCARKHNWKDADLISRCEPPKTYIDTSDAEAEESTTDIHKSRADANKPGLINYDKRPIGFSREERKLQQMISLIARQNHLSDQVVAAADNLTSCVAKSSTTHLFTPSKRPGTASTSSSRKKTKSTIKPWTTSTPLDQTIVPTSLPIESQNLPNDPTMPTFRLTDLPKLDPNFRDKSSGRSLLHKHSSRGNVQAVKELLLKAHHLVHFTDNAGYRALHEAALRGRTEVAKILLEYGADANAAANNGDTALHDAAENGHLEVAEFLLKNGARADLKNNEGWTPVDVAASQDIARLLMGTVHPPEEDPVTEPTKEPPLDHPKPTRPRTRKRGHDRNPDEFTTVAERTKRKPGRPKKGHNMEEMSATTPTNPSSDALASNNTNAGNVHLETSQHSAGSADVLPLTNTEECAEQLILVAIDAPESKSSREWYFLSSQLEYILGHDCNNNSHITRPEKHRFISNHTELSIRKLSSQEKQRILSLPRLGKIPTLISKMMSKDSASQDVHLIEKDSLFAALARDGIKVSSLKVIYMDIPRLLIANGSSQSTTCMVNSTSLEDSDDEVSFAHGHKVATDSMATPKHLVSLFSPNSSEKVIAPVLSFLSAHKALPPKLKLKMQKRLGSSVDVNFVANDAKDN